MRSLILLPVAALLASCLIDQPIEPEQQGEEVGNHAPLILGRAPSATLLHIQRPCSPRFTFSRLEDADLDDLLEVRWFVNYDEGNTAIEDEWVIPPDGTAVRQVEDRAFVLSLDRLSSSTVVVEAVASDGFGDTAEPPFNRAVARGRGVAVATWTIIVTEASWCNFP